MQSSPRGQRMRDLRRAAAEGGIPQNVETVRPAVELDREAKNVSETLRQALKAQPPWSRDVEVHRQRCRDLFLSLLFGHPLSTHAQSLEPLWHHTTYSLISAYRAVTANLEAQLQGNNPSGNRNKDKNQQRGQQAELKKVLTRFKQVLQSEDTFYRSLVSRLVGFYQLQPLSREYLSAVSIGVPESVNNGGPEQGLAPSMSFEEKKEKLGLVYKALICLGDLERYKQQYDDNTRRQARDGRVDTKISAREKFTKAWTYYEVARSLIPDDGSAFNQLAVISTYLQDELLCVYFYFRALAVKNAFKNIQEILDKFLRKIYERWIGKLQRKREGQGEEEEVKDAQEEIKGDLLVIVAILYRRSGLSAVEKLEAQFAHNLTDLLQTRQMSSETIVKLTTIVIGTHWQARQSANVNPAGDEDPKVAQRRLETEVVALRLLLNVFGQTLAVAAGEVEEALRARANGSAVDMENDHEPELHVHISAVLRRLLPSLRIFSKWLKLHLEYVSRIQRTGVIGQQIEQFWEMYTRLVIALATLFPIDHLPSLVQPLEEDIDMKGFIPLAWGMVKGTGDGEQHDFHPNEEQLMRIADIQVDAKLLAQTQSGASVMNPSGAAQALPRIPMVGRDGMDDLASVSTETEDDPVNMAMRATLAPSSVDDEELRHDDEDEEEEIILWNGPSRASYQPVPARSPAVSTPLAQAASPSRDAPTAQDLLQNLILGSTSPAPAYVPSPQLSQHAIPRQSPSAQVQSHAPQSSPGMLFGGDAKGSSIWTMTREESGRGQQRTAGPPNVNIANIWANDGTPSPSSMGANVPGMPVPGGSWHRPSGSGGWSDGQGLASSTATQGHGAIGGPVGGTFGPIGVSGQRGSPAQPGWNNGPWAGPPMPGQAQYPR